MPIFTCPPFTLTTLITISSVILIVSFIFLEMISMLLPQYFKCIGITYLMFPTVPYVFGLFKEIS